MNGGQVLGCCGSFGTLARIQQIADLEDELASGYQFGTRFRLEVGGAQRGRSEDLDLAVDGSVLVSGDL